MILVIRVILRILMSAMVLNTLVVLGWGIRDFGLFFVSRPRAAFLPVMLIAMVCAAATAQKPTKKGRRTPLGQKFVLASVQVVTLPLLLFLPFADKFGLLVIHAEWIRWLELGAALAGYATILVALRALGRNYSVYVTIQEQHRLVQTGIYNVVRNPIYLGTMLSWPGACLVVPQLAGTSCVCYFLACEVLRGAQEERVLREEFDGEFEAYRHGTWRLVPFVY